MSPKHNHLNTGTSTYSQATNKFPYKKLLHHTKC